MEILHSHEFTGEGFPDESSPEFNKKATCNREVQPASLDAFFWNFNWEITPVDLSYNMVDGPQATQMGEVLRHKKKHY